MKQSKDVYCPPEFMLDVPPQSRRRLKRFRVTVEFQLREDSSVVLVRCRDDADEILAAVRRKLGGQPIKSVVSCVEV